MQYSVKHEKGKMDEESLETEEDDEGSSTTGDDDDDHMNKHHQRYKDDLENLKRKKFNFYYFCCHINIAQWIMGMIITIQVITSFMVMEFFMSGSGCFFTLENWRKYSNILKLYPIFVYGIEEFNPLFIFIVFLELISYLIVLNCDKRKPNRLIPYFLCEMLILFNIGQILIKIILSQTTLGASYTYLVKSILQSLSFLFKQELLAMIKNYLNLIVSTVLFSRFVTKAFFLSWIKTNYQYSLLLAKEKAIKRSIKRLATLKRRNRPPKNLDEYSDS
uniref:Uncharacterized protein n=1 Tax=Metapenaeus joyneri majanivirus TaxID=2984280 RepID=A0A9C7BMJ5_9VIRU|nr:MAG: hypothetical protein [Metapenaeus joyneri majanivirus]